MAAPWDLPVSLTRLAVGTALAVPRRGARLVSDVVGLVDDLARSAERIDRLLDGIEQVPPRVVAVLEEVEVVLASVVPIPDRVEAVLARVEPVVPRVEDVLVAVEGVPPRVEVLLGSVTETVDAVRPVLTAATRHTKAAGVAIAQVQGLLADAEPLLRTAARLDPAVLEGLVTVLEQAEMVLASTVRLSLVERVEAEVIPAVSSLEGLVPVVARLAVVVDNLNEQVNDVGGMLGGIPGASRLLKRGEVRKAVEH